MRRFTSQSLPSRAFLLAFCLIALGQLASCKTALLSKTSVSINANVFINQRLILSKSEICYSAKLANQNEVVIDKIQKSGNPYSFLQTLPQNECRFVVCSFQQKESSYVGLLFWRPLRVGPKDQAAFVASLSYVSNKINDFDFSVSVTTLSQLSPAALAPKMKGL